MQRLTYVVFINLAHCYEKRPCQLCTLGQLALDFCLCTSLVPRSMIVLFGLGTRLHVHMRTNLENCILQNGQQLQCAVNGMTWVNFKF